MGGWSDWGLTIDDLFPIVAVYPPTRWQRLKAWVCGKQAETIVIRKIL